MSSCYGRNIKISIFGQSHSPAIGVVADGLPFGFKLDTEELAAFMARRAPGSSDLSTKRKEPDSFKILSGLKNGILCGAPFAAEIENSDTRSKDYSQFKDTPRPGHADYTAQVKYDGFQDEAGGGHFSGRLTAPLCLIGGICMQILKNEGIHIGAHVERIAGIKDERFDPVNISPADFSDLSQMALPVLDSDAGAKMKEAILDAKELGDSVGGIIECAVTGLPAGVGDPMFDGMENLISSIVFAIPAVKAIEFGAGFDACDMLGSENNDSYIVKDGQVVTETNNHGGILGGITSGMPLIFRAGIKPTPSIFKAQKSVSLSEMKEKTLEIKGRHDPCIVPRAVPRIEAAAAIAVCDALLEYKKYK
ncbi:MAG: chorismate synthase [Firmicutes bacterium]|nr:chorismate synthase [Bacillota bacterium]